MINIQKKSSGMPDVDEGLLKNALQKTFSYLKEPDMDLTLRLTDDREMRQLNQAFRDEAKTTDVLSFIHDVTDPESGRLYLGDIIISIDQAKKQADEHAHTLDNECAFLAIHGALHLFGYDHADPEEQKEMWRLQDLIYHALLGEEGQEGET
jgi:probable rRNA maturation factor